MTCNMMGSIHCNRELRPSDVACSAGAHLHHEKKPHAWRVLRQCYDCRDKERALANQLGPTQGLWASRRRACGLSLGEFARKVKLKFIELSTYERLLAEAPFAVASKIEYTLKQFEKKQST